MVTPVVAGDPGVLKVPCHGVLSSKEVIHSVRSGPLHVREDVAVVVELYRRS